jgi:hypothetical protein
MSWRVTCVKLEKDAKTIKSRAGFWMAVLIFCKNPYFQLRVYDMHKLQYTMFGIFMSVINVPLIAKSPYHDIGMPFKFNFYGMTGRCWGWRNELLTQFLRELRGGSWIALVFSSCALHHFRLDFVWFSLNDFAEDRLARTSLTNTNKTLQVRSVVFI